MTDKEKLEKVRAEIERRRNSIKKEEPSFDNYTTGWHDGNLDLLCDLLSFIDSMQEEPKSFDEAIQEGDDVRYNEDLGCRVNLSRLKRVAKKEATGKLKECIDNITEESLAKARKQLQESVSEDLVKAAFDNAQNNYKEGFRGSVMQAFCEGVDWQRQQMMKDAVETEYWDNSLMLDAEMRGKFTDGEKVKLIIIKE